VLLFFEIEISADEGKEKPCLSINLPFFFRNILLDIYKHAELIIKLQKLILRR
jgi:hypothetical protein